MFPLKYLRLVCINPSIIPHAQIQDITSEFSTNTTLQLCAVVDSYYLVKAVDNTSGIYTALEKIANDTIQFCVSLMLLSTVSSGHIYDVCCTHKSVNKCMNFYDGSLSRRRRMPTMKTVLLMTLDTDVVRLLKYILKCKIS